MLNASSITIEDEVLLVERVKIDCTVPVPVRKDVPGTGSTRGHSPEIGSVESGTFPFKKIVTSQLKSYRRATVVLLL
jgi:hypothetical protein